MRQLADSLTRRFTDSLAANLPIHLLGDSLAQVLDHFDLLRLVGDLLFLALPEAAELAAPPGVEGRGDGRRGGEVHEGRLSLVVDDEDAHAEHEAGNVAEHAEFVVVRLVLAVPAVEVGDEDAGQDEVAEPDLAKLEALREFLGTLGIKVPTGQRLRPADLNRVLHEVADKPVSQLVSQTVLRSQSQAVYSPDNLGHFGLALARYAHFTSPIRRFPDLIVHRALIAAYGLGEGGLSTEDRGRFTEFGEHLSMCERRAVAAERGAMDRYVVAFMAQHVGATFAGRITSVTRFGLFAALDGTGADGLIPIRSLGQEFFRHDEGRQVLIGERTGETFGLGDRVKLKLVEADAATAGLLFEIVDVIERVERHALPRGQAHAGRGAPRRPVAHRGPPRDKGSRRRK